MELYLEGQSRQIKVTFLICKVLYNLTFVLKYLYR